MPTIMITVLNNVQIVKKLMHAHPTINFLRVDFFWLELTIPWLDRIQEVILNEDNDDKIIGDVDYGDHDNLAYDEINLRQLETVYPSYFRWFWFVTWLKHICWWCQLRYTEKDLPTFRVVDVQTTLRVHLYRPAMSVPWEKAAEHLWKYFATFIVDSFFVLMRILWCFHALTEHAMRIQLSGLLEEK